MCRPQLGAKPHCWHTLLSSASPGSPVPLNFSSSPVRRGNCLYTRLMLTDVSAVAPQDAVIAFLQLRKFRGKKTRHKGGVGGGIPIPLCMCVSLDLASKEMIKAEMIVLDSRLLVIKGQATSCVFSLCLGSVALGKASCLEMLRRPCGDEQRLFANSHVSEPSWSVSFCPRQAFS